MCLAPLRGRCLWRAAIVGVIGAVTLSSCVAPDEPAASTTSGGADGMLAPVTSRPESDLVTVSGDGGASVRVPAAVGGEGERISVDRLTSLDGILPTGDPAAFAGGVVLEPHGLTFETPVTITIPLIRPLPSGRGMRLFHWDGVSEGWEETDVVATVAEDGRTATAEVTHFSYYVLQPSVLGYEDLGVFGDILGTVRATTRDGGDLDAAYQAVFNEVVSHASDRFPLGDRRPFTVPVSAVSGGYNCYAPVGLDFNFYHGNVGGGNDPPVLTIGDTEDVEFRIDFHRELDVFVKAGDVENQVVGLFTVKVFWRSFAPELVLTAGDEHLWAGDSTALSTDLLCGDLGMVDQEVGFSVTPGGAGMEVEPEHARTDDDGAADARLATHDDAFGNATVTATYDWTNMVGDETEVVSDSVRVAIGGLTGSWTVSGSERWSNCEEPTDDGTYSGTASARFVQQGETFTGRGSFPRGSDMIEGTVRRISEDAFTVDGTSRYAEEYRSCRGDECFVWTVRGTLEFEGTGSIATESIEFEWAGRDLAGDSCTFRGEGTAVRHAR